MQNPWGANKNAANSANASRKHRTHDRKRQAPDRFRATRYRAPHPAIVPAKYTATAQPRPRAARKHRHSAVGPVTARETGKIRASKGPGS